MLYPVIDKEKTGKRIRKLVEERCISVKDVRDYLSLESVQSIYYWFSGRKLDPINVPFYTETAVKFIALYGS